MNIDRIEEKNFKIIHNEIEETLVKVEKAIPWTFPCIAATLKKSGKWTHILYLIVTHDLNERIFFFLISDLNERNFM